MHLQANEVSDHTNNEICGGRRKNSANFALLLLLLTYCFLFIFLCFFLFLFFLCFLFLFCFSLSFFLFFLLFSLPFFLVFCPAKVGGQSRSRPSSATLNEEGRGTESNGTHMFSPNKKNGKKNLPQKTRMTSRCGQFGSMWPVFYVTAFSSRCARCV